MHIIKKKSVLSYSTYNQLFVSCFREKILFNIFDGSGSLDVTAFGKHSTELTGMSASINYLCLGVPFPLESINRSLSGQHYIMKIRKRERYMGDSMHHQYVVLNMLLHKAMDNVGCSTAITDATLSVSRELFPPGLKTVWPLKMHLGPMIIPTLHLLLRLRTARLLKM
ncbi:hypothetical protein ACJIZ3_000001 [Penstemon smallii]|uniref:Uncharacterized protein n=2 Tax=Penstemon smallii TaxID=265156 RepID=A0ABD3RSM0_9LAMI